MSFEQRISFLGGGNMAAALIQGLLAAGTSRPDRILACDIRPEALAELAKRHGIDTTQDNVRACAADVIVLSVKPQIFPTLLPEIAPHLPNEALVISIAAGVPLRAIEARLPAGTRVVRAMPNTPALVGAGATALAAGSHASARDLETAETIFASVGTTVRVDEVNMDAVTALSGSGPAYVFLLTEALTSAGISVGLPAETAALLARQTVHGAGKLLAQSEDDAAELRRKVTSPGGTTHAGVTKLEALGFRQAVTACVEAARDRGRELGAEAERKLAQG